MTYVIRVEDKNHSHVRYLTGFCKGVPCFAKEQRKAREYTSESSARKDALKLVEEADCHWVDIVGLL